MASDEWEAGGLYKNNNSGNWLVYTGFGHYWLTFATGTKPTSLELPWQEVATGIVPKLDNFTYVCNISYLIAEVEGIEHDGL